MSDLVLESENRGIACVETDGSGCRAHVDSSCDAGTLRKTFFSASSTSISPTCMPRARAADLRLPLGGCRRRGSSQAVGERHLRGPQDSRCGKHGGSAGFGGSSAARSSASAAAAELQSERGAAGDLQRAVRAQALPYRPERKRSAVRSGRSGGVPWLGERGASVVKVGQVRESLTSKEN